jgi:predicted nucleic acid-binding Zn ribbon protein
VNRRAPRPLSAALAALAPALEPASPLARVQAVWDAAVGEAIAARCTPVDERGGVLHVSCDEAAWSAEVDLMGPQIVDRLSAALGREEIASLRVRTGGSRPSDYRD